MDAENIVTLSEIEKSYTAGGERLYVLKRVSLTVNKGEYLAILGASGSGKSTLMNIIGCMDTSDSGQYLLDGVDVNTCNDAGLTALRNQKIGFIFQKYHLIPQYTVLQNVMLPLLIRGKTRTEAAKMVEEYIRMVGLWELISEKYEEYAAKVLKELRANDIDATVDNRSEKIGFKIREARLAKLPYMLVVGEQEEADGLVSVRSRFAGDEGQKPLAEFIRQIGEEIRTKEIRRECEENEGARKS